MSHTRTVTPTTDPDRFTPAETRVFDAGHEIYDSLSYVIYGLMEG